MGRGVSRVRGRRSKRKGEDGEANGRGGGEGVRVLVDEGGGVEDFVVDHDEEVLLRRVLRDVGVGVFLAFGHWGGCSWWFGGGRDVRRRRCGL